MGLFDRFKKKDKKEESVEKIEFASDLENRVLFNKATECLQERKNEEAIELFEELIKREPVNIHALNGKGSGLMQAGRLDEAEEVFNQSLAIKESEMAYLNKAIISGNKGDYDNAIKLCDKAAELYPGLKDVANGVKNNFIEKMNQNADDDFNEFNPEARALIEKANALKDKDEMWEGDELHNELMKDTPKFKKVTVWEAWRLYEEAMEKDPSCEKRVISYINELKAKLIQEFLFFDISQNEDFNPGRELDHLKLIVMKDILMDNDFTHASIVTKQILTTIDENDIDAINFKGAISFYFDELDEALDCFEKVSKNGNGIYEFFGDFNKAFVLRRKTMVTHDAEYMVQAMDIYDEMLKDPQTYDKVKPYQREILDTLQDFMGVPLF